MTKSLVNGISSLWLFVLLVGGPPSLAATDCAPAGRDFSFQGLVSSISDESVRKSFPGEGDDFDFQFKEQGQEKVRAVYGAHSVNGGLHVGNQVVFSARCDQQGKLQFFMWHESFASLHGTEIEGLDQWCQHTYFSHPSLKERTTSDEGCVCASSPSASMKRYPKHRKVSEKKTKGKVTSVHLTFHNDLAGLAGAIITQNEKWFKTKKACDEDLKTMADREARSKADAQKKLDEKFKEYE